MRDVDTPRLRGAPGRSRMRSRMIAGLVLGAVLLPATPSAQTPDARLDDLDARLATGERRLAAIEERLQRAIALAEARIETETPDFLPTRPPALAGVDLVRSIQAGLAALGIDPGPIDGAMGPRTEAAIRSFQTREGMAVDGRASPELLARIEARRRDAEPADVVERIDRPRYALTRSNLRAGPGTGFATIGQIEAGEPLRALARVGDGTWIEVEHRGRRGFLAAQLLDVPEDEPPPEMPAPRHGFEDAPVRGRASVLDTANLAIGGDIVTLWGLRGETDERLVATMQDYLDTRGPVACEPVEDDRHLCVSEDGIDIAQAAVFNGGARATREAYREAEAAARAAGRGIWR